MSSTTVTTTAATFLPQEEAWDIAKSSLVHLRLLFAFRGLRLRIGSRDGLWGIRDDRLDNQTPPLTADEHKQGLARIREKRWAIYLSRAVHRYNAWWQSLNPNPLTESETESNQSARYATFPQNSVRKDFSEKDMIPLDVLMVWHTHMLNPRLYLEDAMRQGRGDIWASGLPWDLIARCLASEDFSYEVWESSKEKWKADTGLQWDNTEDALDTIVTCPACQSPMQVPWTTCGEDEPLPPYGETATNAQDGVEGESSKQSPELPEKPTTPRDLSLEARLNLVGQGLADGKLRHTCPTCSVETDHDLLCFAKFALDVKALEGSDKVLRGVMPGTLLDPRTGMPELNGSVHGIHKNNASLTAPNRLARWTMVGSMGTAMAKYHKDRSQPRPTMESLRKAIRLELENPQTLARLAGEEGAWDRGAMLREMLEGELNNQPSYEPSNEATFKLLFRKPRVVIQRMMSQYNENWSPFALDLRAAMLRQSIFIDNMYRFDWLHGADPPAIMARAVTKYARFLQLARENPYTMVVPTLDVDLAWHTHQLSPQTYYRTTTHYVRKFLDHDDKVDENKLSASFDWLGETYYQRYKEIYSECLCWYCQVTHAGHTNSISARIGVSKRQKAIKDLHDQQAASGGDASSRIGPHISAHNAVRVPNPDRPIAKSEERLYKQHVQRRQSGARTAGILAKKHKDSAKAKGNEKHSNPNDKENLYVDHWGYPYPLPGPWVCPQFFGELMYGGSIASPHPGSGILAEGSFGGCAAGCGNLTNCGSKPVQVPSGQPGKKDEKLLSDVFRIPDDSQRNCGGGGCGGCGG